MKRYSLLFLSLFCSCFLLHAQQGGLGIGVRIGDPTGISLKKYIHDGRNAWELNVGRAYPYDRNYRNYFYDINKFKDKDIYDYDHSVLNNAFDLQLHWMAQRGFKEEKLSGLKWYIGAGAQALMSSIDYYYRDKYYYGPGKTDYVWRYDHSVYVSTAVAADGIIGLEYTFKEVPLSVFMDGTLALEAYPSPFLVWGQAGIGVRYNFSVSTGKTGTTNTKKK
jgi:hypothetical protein